MLKLKLQYFGHLMRRNDSLEKVLMLGKTEGTRRRGWQDEMVGWHHRLDGRGKPGVLQPMGSQRVRYDWATEMNWTTFPRLYKGINTVCPFTCWWTFGLLSSKENCYEYSCTSLCMDTYILFSWVKTESYDRYGATGKEPTSQCRRPKRSLGQSLQVQSRSGRSPGGEDGNPP